MQGACHIGLLVRTILPTAQQHQCYRNEPKHALSLDSTSGIWLLSGDRAFSVLAAPSRRRTLNWELELTPTLVIGQSQRRAQLRGPCIPAVAGCHMSSLAVKSSHRPRKVKMEAQGASACEKGSSGSFQGNLGGPCCRLVCTGAAQAGASISCRAKADPIASLGRLAKDAVAPERVARRGELGQRVPAKRWSSRCFGAA